MGLTQAEAGRRLGISTQAVSKRVAKGQIKRLQDGTLSPKSVEAARAEMDPERRARAKRGIPTPTSDDDGEAKPAEPPAAESKPATTRIPTPHERKTIADAEKAEAIAAKIRGQTIDIAQATRACRDFARRVHDSVLGLADDAQRALDGRVLCACGVPVDSKHIALELERHLRGVLEALAADPFGERKAP